MTARFTVLASGSGGNASLLELDGFGLLIDCGLHPRFLTHRLQSVGASWERVSAVVLTHTHTDHWKDATLAELRARRIPMYAHPKHYAYMERAASFATFSADGLAREYADGRVIDLAKNLSCLPIRVSHDSVPTYGFRIDGHDTPTPTEA